MNYIVIDLELNTVPFNEQYNKEAVFNQEIIEFGAIKLDENFKIISKFTSYVRPVFYPRLNQKVKRLTHINQYQIDNAPNFKNVFLSFFEWMGYEAYTFCAWSENDIPLLIRHCDLYGIKFNINSYIDIQFLFSAINNFENPKSLECALDFLNIPMTVNLHSAIHDVLYSVKILKLLANQNSINILDYKVKKYKNKNLLYRSDFRYSGNYLKTIPKSFRNCPKCGRFSRVISDRWYRQHWNYLKDCKCDNCNIVFTSMIKSEKRTCRFIKKMSNQLTNVI